MDAKLILELQTSQQLARPNYSYSLLKKHTGKELKHSKSGYGYIALRGDWLRSPANIKGANGCQDLCWKVHDRAQSFVLRSYTMHELHDQNLSIG